MIIKKCLKCNSPIEIRGDKNANQKYCSNCKQTHKKEYNQKWKEIHHNYFTLKNKEHWINNKEALKLKQKERHKLNRDQILKKLKDYRDEHKDYFKAKWQEYYLENKETLLLRKKKWNENHKEHNKQISHEYYQTPKGKEVMSYNNKKRKVRIKNVVHDFSRQDWQELLEKTNGICSKCKKYVGINKLTLDHIIPVSMANAGQRYSIDMVQPLCHSCNSRKNDNFSKDELMQLFGKLTDYNEEDTKWLIKQVHQIMIGEPEYSTQ